jgi:AcrR family transcriptional regulator
MVRADARDNRARILAVARDALDKSDTVSLNQIAQDAGVGPGTLYRHFSSRDALVLAVYEDELQQLLGGVHQLLSSHPPRDALRLWTNDLVAAMLKKHALGEAVSQAAHQASADRSYGPIIAAITEFLDAGKATGAIRMDAHPADFLVLTGALWRAASNPDADPQRMLDLILDGLKPAGS